ncbi:DNA-directed RNA polymerase III subunit RPC7-like isoform X2 [Rhodamnia argentea]|uniref:DNA-directed RNA polymerase III subunit n=1 Tax=Rhodamnia argentea TaxID=178133 RepID=A0ABM3H0C0_9MYRT|nr:DNA-directed RNA polymerase III subunit RPC7-like isoform X2 [Rhodamnia argentea]
MAFRGRGRGRGRFGGGGGTSFAKQEPFVLFPDVDLPAVRDVSKEERALVVWSSRLQNFWKSSPYYLEETISSASQSTDIERFSDREKIKAKPTRDSFMQFLDANASNFPRELVADTREEQRRKRRKVQWNPESGLQKLDLFEKLEQKYQGQEEKGEKEKKEGEEEEQDDEVEEADEEFSDDGDYNQNVDFDDDEDDFNMADDNDDEGIF